MSAQQFESEQLPTDWNSNHKTIEDVVSQAAVNSIPCFPANTHKNNSFEKGFHPIYLLDSCCMSSPKASQCLEHPTNSNDQPTKEDLLLHPFSTKSTNNNLSTGVNFLVHRDIDNKQNGLSQSLEHAGGGEFVEFFKVHEQQDKFNKKAGEIINSQPRDMDNLEEEEEEEKSQSQSKKSIQIGENQQNIQIFCEQPQEEEDIFGQIPDEGNSGMKHSHPQWWVSKQKENSSVACFGPALTRIPHQHPEFQQSSNYKVIDLEQLKDCKLFEQPSDSLEIPIPAQEGHIIPPNQQPQVELIPRRLEHIEIQLNSHQQQQLIYLQNQENQLIPQNQLRRHRLRQGEFSDSEVKDIEKVLRNIIWILAFSTAFNMLLTTLTIIGLDDSTDQKQEYAKTVFETVTLSIILGASSIVTFLDLSLLGRLKIKEMRHLAKKEYTLMILQQNDLIDGWASIKRFCRKFPFYHLLQLLMKITQFTVSLFALFYKNSKSKEWNSSSDSSTITSRALEIASICISVNLLLYLLWLCLVSVVLLREKCSVDKNNQEILQRDQARDGKIITYKNKSQLGKCEDTCIICYMDYAINDQLIVLNCDAGHIFHQHCLDYWLEINKSCPICKQVL